MIAEIKRTHVVTTYSQCDPGLIRLWRNAITEFGVPDALVPVKMIDEPSVGGDVA